MDSFPSAGHSKRTSEEQNRGLVATAGRTILRVHPDQPTRCHGSTEGGLDRPLIPLILGTVFSECCRNCSPKWRGGEREGLRLSLPLAGFLCAAAALLPFPPPAFACLAPPSVPTLRLFTCDRHLLLLPPSVPPPPSSRAASSASSLGLSRLPLCPLGLSFRLLPPPQFLASLAPLSLPVGIWTDMTCMTKRAGCLPWCC